MTPDPVTVDHGTEFPKSHDSDGIDIGLVKEHRNELAYEVIASIVQSLDDDIVDRDEPTLRIELIDPSVMKSTARGWQWTGDHELATVREGTRESAVENSCLGYMDLSLSGNLPVPHETALDQPHTHTPMRLALTQ